MKKTIVLALSVLMMFLAVSCATTKGADIPDVVRVVEPIALDDAHSFDSESLWSALKLISDDTVDADEVKLDEASKTLSLNGITLASNVGMLANDGEVEVKATIRVDGSNAVATVSFVDAYTFYQMGPISKKISTGLTSLGMKEYEIQSGALLDLLESMVNQATYLYGVKEGWYGEEVQKAYLER